MGSTIIGKMSLRTYMILTLLLLATIQNLVSGGLLYPRATESREILNLDGTWDFTLTTETNEKRGYHEKWYKKNLRDVANTSVELMPVPSSYNDIGTNSELRDHSGIAWYQRKFFVPKSWEDGNKRVWIRFASVTRGAEVWINGKSAVTHSIGHLPFQADVTDLLQYGDANLITVSVDNTLSDSTIPPGWSTTLDNGRKVVSHNFDFFNYAGIDRPVVLYTTSSVYIDDITITTDVGADNTTGIVNYIVDVNGDVSGLTIAIALNDQDGNTVATSNALKGTFTINNAKLWWPLHMNQNVGYMHNFDIKLLDSSSNIVDHYIQPIGIRKLSWYSDSIKVNHIPIYLRGFSRHEDSDFRGNALDLPILVRDAELLVWTGANSFKAANFPYSEENLQLADIYGFMVIDEAPAVNLNGFSDDLLTNHKQALSELIQRDKLHPSVIMWSAAKDVSGDSSDATDYFKSIVDHIKSLDASRPITIATALSPDSDKSVQFVDVISVNTLEGWNDDNGDLDVVATKAGNTIRNWHQKFNVPIIVTQYGAESQEGLHYLPTFVWSEEYQQDLLSTYFELFDELRFEGVLFGEMVITFADYKTKQDYMKVGGNKKGVFTRNRQPKNGAFSVRERYWELAMLIDQAEKPKDIKKYVASNGKTIRNEL